MLYLRHQSNSFDMGDIKNNRRRSSVAQEGNPLKDDPTLRKLSFQLDKIKSNRKWEPWKASFMKRFESFLEQEGINNADDAYAEFGQRMDRTTNLVSNCETLIAEGKLTNECVTVKGRHALNEMVNALVEEWAAIRDLIPSTGFEEDKRGYNKFQLGAVLVRDDFSEYERMKHINDVIQIMTDVTLSEIADRVHLEQFANFQTQFARFCDVMADLGLYEVMMACRKFSDDDVEDEDDSLTEEETSFGSDSFVVESIIMVDMKTASIFRTPLDEAFEKGIINMAPRPDDLSDASDEYMIHETCRSESEREEIKNKLKNHPTLGVATRLVIRKSTIIEEEYTDLGEKDAVSALWGVALKSTNKKKRKSEELFFFDPYTGAVGQLDRAKAVKVGCITETRNEFDKLVLAQAIDNDEAWESMREKIRSIMGIQMEEDTDTRTATTVTRYSTGQAPSLAF